MNNPTPMPPLTPLSQPAKGKPNVRLAVITIVALHAVFFGGLLFQGCKPKTPESSLGSDLASGTNGMDYGALTNQPYADSGLAPIAGTNAAPINPFAGAPAGTTTQQQYVVAPPPTMGQPLQPLPTAQVPQPVLQPTLPIPTGGGEYSIARGDTLAKIAKDHGVSVAALTKANPGVDPRKLQVGQKLTIPTGTTPAAPQLGTAPTSDAASTGGVQQHVVQGGDTLTKIARQYGLSLKELRSANGLKTDRLQVGQKLKIPAKKTASTQGAGAATLPGTVQ